MRPSLLASALLLAIFGVPSAHAETGTIELDQIVVSATRTQRVATDVPNTVDVIERKRMDELLVRDLRDLFRYEPGLTVGSNFGRFGISDVRIRGLGGNRVRIETDGIAVPDAFLIGSFSNANRNFVDMDTLKRVEVVRGPTSSLYGSDALGGVVSFVTKDPTDYLRDGRSSHFGLRLGHEGAWDGYSLGVTSAFGNERWSGMVVANHHQGHEPENRADIGGTGATRTLPNPQDRDGRSLLAKLAFAPDTGQRVVLAVEGNEDKADTDMLSSQGVQALTGAINDRVLADDRQTRARISLSHELTGLKGWLADDVDWQIYRQDSETSQYTREERTLPAPTLADLREREFNFDQRAQGLQINARKAIFGESSDHMLAWGLDFSHLRTRQKRDGLLSYPLTGDSTKLMMPDDFPVRDFPNSRTINAAVYLQDEISFADDRFRLIPALRVDHYRLSPQLDNIFAEGNPGVDVVELKETNLSPKLGGVWHINDEWSLFGGYSRGFRSPPYNDVNIGFTNVMFGYTAIANPDLRPETSNGLEAGLRYAGNALHFSLAGYQNRYHDFIESLGFVGYNDAGLMIYQSRNVADARIHGVELKAGLDLGALSPAWDGWTLHAAAAQSRGEDRTAGEPLESIDPATATVGAAYAGERWGTELVGRFAAKRDRLPPATAGTEYFASPGYAVFDLYIHWNITDGARLDVGLRNLADRKYWDAGLLPLVSDSSTTLDRYTAAGRNVAANLSFTW